MERDPQSAIALNMLGLATWVAGRNEEAVRHYVRATELQPSLFLPHWALLFLHGEAGRVDQARVAASNTLARMSPGTPIRDGDVDALVRAARGEAPAEVSSRAGRVLYDAGMKSFGPVVAFTFAGQVDSAIAWLDVAVDRRNTWLPVFLDLLEEHLAVDPRWDALVARMGLD